MTRQGYLSRWRPTASRARCCQRAAPARPLQLGEDERLMSSWQECVHPVALGIQADGVRSLLRGHDLDLRRRVDIEDLDEPRVADRDIQAVQYAVEEDHVWRAGERQVGHDLIGGWRKSEQSPFIAGAV